MSLTSLKNKLNNRYFLYDSCRELPLRTFCRVVNEKSHRPLSKIGFIFPFADTNSAWADILLEYAKLDNNYSIQENWDDNVELNRLQNSYTTIKAMIRLLWYVSPLKKSKFQKQAEEAFKDLNAMGYKIILDSSEEYLYSLKKADKKCNSIITLIQMKKNKMESNHEETDINFDEIMTMLSVNAKMTIPDDITVSRYISYKNTIIRKIKSSRNGNT